MLAGKCCLGVRGPERAGRYPFADSSKLPHHNRPRQSPPAPWRQFTVNVHLFVNQSYACPVGHGDIRRETLLGLLATFQPRYPPGSGDATRSTARSNDVHRQLLEGAAVAGRFTDHVASVRLRSAGLRSAFDGLPESARFHVPGFAGMISWQIGVVTDGHRSYTIKPPHSHQFQMTVAEPQSRGRMEPPDWSSSQSAYHVARLHFGRRVALHSARSYHSVLASAEDMSAAQTDAIIVPLMITTLLPASCTFKCHAISAYAWQV